MRGPGKCYFGAMTYTPLAPEIAFTPVSPLYRNVQIVARAIPWGVLALALAAACAFWWKQPWTWVFPAAVVVIGIWHCIIAGRQVKAIGYHETAEELLICRGIMFRNLSVIPYGRMQTVTLEAGPILSRFGLANLTLETASAGSMGNIPGLPRAEAERLRIRLTDNAQARLEGI